MTNNDINIENLITTATNAANKAERQQAEITLKEYANQFYSDMVVYLSDGIMNESASGQVRTSFAIFLKNIIVGLPGVTRTWYDVSSETRLKVKSNLFPLLGSSNAAIRNTVSSCISGICSVEFVNKEWLDILDSLDKATETQLNYRIAALMTLKNIMQDVPFGCIPIESLSVVIFTIYKNLNANDPVEVRNESLEALHYAISSFSFILEDDAKRESLIELIVGTINFSEIDLRIKGMQCLNEICRNFYEQIKGSMGALFNITMKVIKEQNPKDLKVQAFEFWITIAMAERKSIRNKIPINNYIQTCEKNILDICIETIKQWKPSEEDEEDSNSLYKLSLYLIKYCSGCCSPDFINSVIAHMTEWMGQNDVVLKYSALSIFNSVLGTIHEETISKIVSESLSEIIKGLDDQNPKIQEVTANIIDQISKYQYTKLVGTPEQVILLDKICQSLDTTNKLALKYILLSLHEISLKYKIEDNDRKCLF